MFTLIIRSLMIYIVALIVIRLMGKRQIAQMQPFELVITLIIADLATIPMTDISIPVLHGIIPLFVLAVLHYFITILSCKSLFFRKFFNGKPIILIGPDGINVTNLKKLNMTINDLLEACRGCNFFCLEDVQYAIMETNGNVSIIPKSSATPLTQEDMKIKNPNPQIPTMIVSNGKLATANLGSLNLDENKIKNVLKEKKVRSIKNVLIFLVDNSGSAYLQIENEPYITFNINDLEVNDG